MQDTPTPAIPSESSVVIPQLDDEQTKPLMVKMARIFRQIAAMPELKRFRQQLRLPIEARRLTQNALHLYDQYLTYAIGQLKKKGWTVYCASGCAACCFAMPSGISALELLIIYDHLREAGQLERFFRKNLENCEVLSRVRSELGREVHPGKSRSEDDVQAELLAYSRARQTCAFLTESKECLIYSVRPLACRMHFGFTPPEWCDPAHPSFPQAVHFNLHPHGEVHKALELVDESLGLEVGELLSPGLVTLTANIMRFSAICWVDSH